MNKILYDKKISFENQIYSYRLIKDEDRIIMEGEEAQEASILFRMFFDVSGYNPSYMISFLEELVNTQTRPSFFKELLEENPQFFFSPLEE